MEGAVIIIFLILGVGIYMFRTSSHESRIEEEVRVMGGTVINIERRNFFTGIGPFTVVGKGRMVYKIDYEVDGKEKVGWVRFGGMFGADWRW